MKLGYRLVLGGTYVLLSLSVGPIASAQQEASDWRDAARTAYSEGRFDDAAQYYGRAADMDSNHPGTFAGLGASATAAGNHALAVRAYERAVQLVPNNAAYFVSLARAYEQVGRPDDAVRAYRQVLTIDPNNAAATSGLAALETAAPEPATSNSSAPVQEIPRAPTEEVEPPPRREEHSAEEEANAEGLEDEESASSERRLSGHYFIPADNVPNPFVTTHFGQTTGLGYASFSCPEVDLTGAPTGNTITCSFAAAQLALEAQLGIANIIAIRGAFAGNALAGTDADSAARLNMFGYAFGAGATAAFRVADRFQLGFAADFRRETNYLVTVMNAIAASVMSGQVMFDSLLTLTANTTFSGGLRAALGLHRIIGISAFVDYRHTLNVSEQGDNTVEDDSGAVALGGAVDLDFRPIPFGILGGYATTLSLKSGARPEHNFVAGFQYTGRASLALGVEAQIIVLPTAGAEDITAYQGVFRLRYYW